MTTRRLWSALLTVFVSVGSSGCLVVSLHPAYGAETIVFDEALLGVWGNSEDNATVTIKRGEWRSYDIAYKENTNGAALTGYLTKIGGALILDVSPKRGVDPGPYLIPVHGVFRLTVSGDTLTSSALSFDWAQAALKGKTLGSVQGVFDDRDNVVLTSDTAALRAWLAARLKQPDAFAPPATFQRR